MSRSRIPAAAVLLPVAVAWMSGCGQASVKLEMANQSPASALQASLAGGGPGRTFKMKLLEVYLAEDVDPVTLDNIGQNAMIWVNPACAGDEDGCNISGIPGSGPTVTSFFDFSLPTEQVNAALNSQGQSVPAGTYRYARIDFCKDGPPDGSDPNLMWSGPTMTAESAASVGDCGRTSQAFDPPLVVKDGDSVTVTLAYDLSQSIQSGAPESAALFSLAGVVDADGSPHAFRFCEDTGPATRDCMDFPNLVPSAAKN